MRINDMMQIPNAYRPSSTKAKGSTTVTQAKEEYSPSAAARDYHIARRALQNTSDVRQSRIDDISARIANGTYRVSADAVAAAIIGN